MNAAQAVSVWNVRRMTVDLETRLDDSSEDEGVDNSGGESTSESTGSSTN